MSVGISEKDLNPKCSFLGSLPAWSGEHLGWTNALSVVETRNTMPLQSQEFHNKFEDPATFSFDHKYEPVDGIHGDSPPNF